MLSSAKQAREMMRVLMISHLSQVELNIRSSNTDFLSLIFISGLIKFSHF